MLTITRRLFKMFLLLFHINARVDPNTPTNGSPFLRHFQHSSRLIVRTAARQDFKMQRALKMKCDVRAPVLKRQGDFNDAVGPQVALSIGSDRYGRRCCAAGRRPRGRRMFVARSLFLAQPNIVEGSPRVIECADASEVNSVKPAWPWVTEPAPADQRGRRGARPKAPGCASPSRATSCEQTRQSFRQ
jgi:hypothetical protein